MKVRRRAKFRGFVARVPWVYDRYHGKWGPVVKQSSNGRWIWLASLWWE